MNKERANKLESMMFLLTLNFFRENPESYFPCEAFIDEGIIYNCSYAELVYDFFFQHSDKLRIKTTICDDGLKNDKLIQTIIYRKRGYDEEYLYGNPADLRDADSEWEKAVSDEYKRRELEFKENWVEPKGQMELRF